MALRMLTTTLVFLIAGGSAFTGAVNKDLKAYTLYPGVGYFQALVPSSMNWTQAREYCLSTGGHLAVPNSEAEAEVYKQIIAEYPANYQNNVFIGFHDLFVNGDYETIHATTLDAAGYNTWESGYPAYGIDNLYTYVALYRNNGSLIMLPATYKLSFFCEHEL